MHKLSFASPWKLIVHSFRPKIGTKVAELFWMKVIFLVSFWPTYTHSLWSTFWNKSLEETQKFKIPVFSQNWGKIAHLPQNSCILGNFSHVIFLYLLFLIMVQSSKRILWADSKNKWIIKAYRYSNRYAYMHRQTYDNSLFGEFLRR